MNVRPTPRANLLRQYPLSVYVSPNQNESTANARHQIDEWRKIAFQAVFGHRFLAPVLASGRRLRRLPVLVCLLGFTLAQLGFGDQSLSQQSSPSSAGTARTQPCPTCPQSIGLDDFRAAVGGNITTVLVELQEPTGLMRQMSAEKNGRAMMVKDLIDHGLSLQARQKGFIASLPSRGVRALLREAEARQVDGSLRHVQYQLTYLLNGFVAFVATEDLARLRALPEVRRVFELRPPRLMLNTAIDYSLGLETNITARRIAVYGTNLEFRPVPTAGHPETPESTRIDGIEGQNMIIAVIDSGVDWRHPMFGGTGQNTPVPHVSGAPASTNDNQKIIYYYALSSPGNPSDDFGHGTLVSSCAAGYLVDGNTPANAGYGVGENGTGIGPTPGGVQLHGMAPQARIMMYKVCGPADQCAGDTELAIEDAASPYTLAGSAIGGAVTNTGIPKPVADVINLSLGNSSGDPADPTAVMANNAALAGTIVVCAAGNSGPAPSTIGSPATATLAISAAAGFDPGSFGTADLLASNQISDARAPLSAGPAPVTGANSTALIPQPGGRQQMQLFPAFGGGPIPQGSVSAYYVFVDRSGNTNPVPLEVQNRIALVRSSGTATFFQLANSVAPLHPAAIFIITSVQSATAFLVVSNVPTYTIGPDDGNYLMAQMVVGTELAAPTNGMISPLPLRVGASADLATFQPGIASFSSRGPLNNPNARFRVIKPDVGAPGVNILGAATPTGVPDATIGIADPSGYAVASGTSFASPITAGSMILVRQHLRDIGLDTTNVSALHYRSTRFDAVTIARALIMNSASNLRNGLGITQGDGTNTTASIDDIGAGFINVDGAVHAQAIMVAPTLLLADIGEFTAPTNDPPAASDFDTNGNLHVFIPSASFGPVPIVGVSGTIVLTQQVILRDITGGGGSGTYNLAFEDNRNLTHVGFLAELVSAQGTPISSVNVPVGGEAAFYVRVTANGGLLNVDPTEFQWYVTATQSPSGQILRLPLYYRAVAPTLANITSPVQGPIVADLPQGTNACAADTNASYTLQWTYTAPNGGPTPVAFRVQEAMRSSDVFFDPGSEVLVGGGNSTWSAGNDWSSQVNPNNNRLAYFVPDTTMQNSALTMLTNFPVPPGGATLSFLTAQDLEETFDFCYVEISTDNGTTFTPVGSYTFDFVGTRIIDVSQYAGQSIKLRFRIASDTFNGPQDPAPTGWYIQDIRITSDDFHTIASPGPAATSYTVAGRANGTYYYRIAGLFSTDAGNAPGPYSDNTCVTETVGVLDLVSISVLTNGHALLNCLSPALAKVRVQAGTDLHNWTTLGTNTAGSNGAFQFEDSAAPGFRYRFYRLVTP